MTDFADSGFGLDGFDPSEAFFSSFLSDFDLSDLTDFLSSSAPFTGELLEGGAFASPFSDSPALDAVSAGLGVLRSSGFGVEGFGVLVEDLGA